MTNDSYTIMNNIRGLLELGCSKEDLAKSMGLTESMLDTCLELMKMSEALEQSGKNKDEKSAVKEECVTLSLESYTKMTEGHKRLETRCDSLEMRNEYLQDQLKKIGIPEYIIDKIGKEIPVTCYQQENIQCNSVKYRIEFDVPMEYWGARFNL